MSENKFTPSVVLPGFGQSKVELTDKAGEKIKMAWPLEVNSQKLIGKLKAPMMKMMLLRKDAGFSDKVASILEEVTDPITSNPEGTIKSSLRVVSYPQSIAKCTENEKKYIYKMVPLNGLAEIIGEENLYYFAYNPFGEPYETADLLDAFIEKVKTETGSEKVNLIPVSLGGVISIAYLSKYAYKNSIKRVMYFVAALAGSHLFADIAEKKIISEKGLSLVALLTSQKIAEQLSDIIPMTPVGVPEAVLMKTIDVLNKVLLGSVTMWGLIPPERYEMLAEQYLKNKEELKKKVDRFFEARRNFPEKVRELEKQGVEFFSVCGYGLRLLDIAKSDRISSDGIIGVSSSSLGAASAPLGEKLNEAKNGNAVCRDKTHLHISPDGTIDASYGLWPEKTWYFYSQQHDNIAYNNTALKIATQVLSDENFKNIYSDPALPQFGIAEDNRSKGD